MPVPTWRGPSIGPRALEVALPSFEIDGNLVEDWIVLSETQFQSASRPDIQLTLDRWLSEDGRVCRFRYRIHGNGKFTKTTGKDQIRYLSLPGWNGDLTEIQVAHFDRNTNIYGPGETVYQAESRFAGQTHPGPILVNNGTALVAYEHGGDTPNTFLHFVNREEVLELWATKGNVYAGQPVDYETVWFHLAVGEDLDDLKRRYRQFFASEICPVEESRRPWIFYNTWNHQERQKYLHGNPYLHEMNLERMLAEIEVAHEIGIEVFVIDTGWYKKTGDWEVNLERFPDGLQTIRKKLDDYGMKLGLWFNPIVAARTSRGYTAHPDWTRINTKGEPEFWGPIWETEESFAMCLCTGWADHFADTLIRLNRELGVSYFKWDAVGLYGCDSAEHDHGTAENSVEERRDAYAFEASRQLVRIVEKVTTNCPGSIVDFDVTESHRYVGLHFLSAGKFFLVNNGPYYHNFNTPGYFKREPDTINAFFFPGPARPRLCRVGFRYDSIIPSGLFLTHYLPDGPAKNQRNSLASLMLGGNGIWGSLPELSDEERAILRDQLDEYKVVREAAARAYPRVIGNPGQSPEIHEKIEVSTGEGFVAFFAVERGQYTHVTQPLETLPTEVRGAKSWQVIGTNRLALTVELESEDAQVVSLRR